MSATIDETTTAGDPADVPQVRENQPAGPNVRRISMDRTYRFPAGTKTPSGGRLRVRPDGTVSYHNPDCITKWKPGSNPFRMPALNPRTDKAGLTFQRLKESIEQRAARPRVKNFARFAGRNVADGYSIVTTDGLAALLIRRPVKDGIFVDWQEGTAGEYSKVFDDTFKAARVVCTIADPEFHLALKRADVMSCERTRKVRLIGLSHRLTIASTDPDCGTFSETLPVQSSEFWQVAFDFRLLEPVIGQWPLVVRYVDKLTAVCFEPADGSWRYVVMPYKDETTDEAAQAEAADAPEVSNEPDQRPTEISNSRNQKKPMEGLCVF